MICCLKTKNSKNTVLSNHIACGSAGILRLFLFCVIDKKKDWCHWLRRFLVCFKANIDIIYSTYDVFSFKKFKEGEPTGENVLENLINQNFEAMMDLVHVLFFLTYIYIYLKNSIIKNVL